MILMNLSKQKKQNNRQNKDSIWILEVKMARFFYELSENGCDNFTGETIENWKIKKSCSKFEFLLDCKKLKINPKWNTK